MRFYYYKDSIEDKEIGEIYPQIKEVESRNKVNWDSILNSGLTGSINSDIQSITLVCHKNSKLTDNLSIIYGSGLLKLISHRFQNLIMKFQIGEVQSWSVEIKQGEKIFDNYYLFHSVNPVHDGVIVYYQSEFEIGRIGDWRNKFGRRSVNIHSSTEYNELNQELRIRNEKENILINKLVLDFRNINLDLFRLHHPSYGGFIVSEKLKQAIEKEGLTGVRFEPVEQDNKIEVVY